MKWTAADRAVALRDAFCSKNAPREPAVHKPPKLKMIKRSSLKYFAVTLVVLGVIAGFIFAQSFPRRWFSSPMTARSAPS